MLKLKDIAFAVHSRLNPEGIIPVLLARIVLSDLQEAEFGLFVECKELSSICLCLGRYALKKFLCIFVLMCINMPLNHLCKSILDGLSGIFPKHLEGSFALIGSIVLLCLFHCCLLLMNSLDLSGNLFLYHCHCRKNLNIESRIVLL